MFYAFTVRYFVEGEALPEDENSAHEEEDSEPPLDENVSTAVESESQHLDESVNSPSDDETMEQQSAKESVPAEAGPEEQSLTGQKVPEESQQEQTKEKLIEGAELEEANNVLGNNDETVPQEEKGEPTTDENVPKEEIEEQPPPQTPSEEQANENQSPAETPSEEDENAEQPPAETPSEEEENAQQPPAETPSEEEENAQQPPAEAPSEEEENAQQPPAETPSEEEKNAQQPYAETPPEEEENEQPPAETPSEEEENAEQPPAETPSEEEENAQQPPAEIPSEEEENAQQPPAETPPEEEENEQPPAETPSEEEENAQQPPAETPSEEEQNAEQPPAETPSEEEENAQQPPAETPPEEEENEQPPAETPSEEEENAEQPPAETPSEEEENAEQPPAETPPEEEENKQPPAETPSEEEQNAKQPPAETPSEEEENEQPPAETPSEEEENEQPPAETPSEEEENAEQPPAETPPEEEENKQPPAETPSEQEENAEQPPAETPPEEEENTEQLPVETPPEEEENAEQPPAETPSEEEENAEQPPAETPSEEEENAEQPPAETPSEEEANTEESPEQSLQEETEQTGKELIDGTELEVVDNVLGNNDETPPQEEIGEPTTHETLPQEENEQPPAETPSEEDDTVHSGQDVSTGFELEESERTEESIIANESDTLDQSLQSELGSGDTQGESEPLILNGEVLRLENKTVLSSVSKSLSESMSESTIGGETESFEGSGGTGNESQPLYLSGEILTFNDTDESEQSGEAESSDSDFTLLEGAALEEINSDDYGSGEILLSSNLVAVEDTGSGEETSGDETADIFSSNLNAQGSNVTEYNEPDDGSGETSQIVENTQNTLAKSIVLKAANEIPNTEVPFMETVESTDVDETLTHIAESDISITPAAMTEEIPVAPLAQPAADINSESTQAETVLGNGEAQSVKASHNGETFFESENVQESVGEQQNMTTNEVGTMEGSLLQPTLNEASEGQAESNVDRPTITHDESIQEVHAATPEVAHALPGIQLLSGPSINNAKATSDLLQTNLVSEIPTTNHTVVPQVNQASEVPNVNLQNDLSKASLTGESLATAPPTRKQKRKRRRRLRRRRRRLRKRKRTKRSIEDNLWGDGSGEGGEFPQDASSSTNILGQNEVLGTADLAPNDEISSLENTEYIDLDKHKTKRSIRSVLVNEVTHSVATFGLQQTIPAIFSASDQQWHDFVVTRVAEIAFTMTSVQAPRNGMVLYTNGKLFNATGLTYSPRQNINMTALQFAFNQMGFLARKYVCVNTLASGRRVEVLFGEIVNTNKTWCDGYLVDAASGSSVISQQILIPGGHGEVIAVLIDEPTCHTGEDGLTCRKLGYYIRNKQHEEFLQQSDLTFGSHVFDLAVQVLLAVSAIMIWLGLVLQLVQMKGKRFQLFNTEQKT